MYLQQRLPALNSLSTLKCRTSEVTSSSKIISDYHPAFQKQKHAIHFMFYTLNCNNSRGDRSIVEVVLQKGQYKLIVAASLLPQILSHSLVRISLLMSTKEHLFYQHVGHHLVFFLISVCSVVFDLL